MLTHSDKTTAQAILRLLDNLPASVYTDITTGWNLSYPLALLIQHEHITGITPEGRDGLQGLLKEVIHQDNLAGMAQS